MTPLTTPPLTPLTATRDNPMPIDALGERIAELAARIHAATYELLVMLREFDEGTGWNNGFLSCAHWLNWRTGIDLGAAREKVRVARALPGLPRIGDALRRGTISYAKVRAITRVATFETEQKLLDVALAGTASHVERIVRAWRRVDRVIAAKEAEARHRSRHLTTWIEDDGMLVLRGRLTPEVGAVVHRALEAAADQLVREAKAAPNAGGRTDDVGWGQRRADALGRLAEVALAADLDAGTAGDRYQVVLHVDATATAAGAVEAVVPFDGALEVDDSAIRVFIGNVAASRLRRRRRAVDPRRPRHRSRRRPQDTDDPRSHPPRLGRSRPAVPVSGLFGAPLRRAPHRALGRWRTNQPRQPGAPMPTPSPGRG